VGSFGAAPSPYVSNAESQMHLSGDCNTVASAFRSRFDYVCDNGTCWHVLRDRLVLDTEAINQGGSSLVGKVAQGNFNYRLGSVGVNLVGTGLLDCNGQGSGCYQTAYLEYELQHEAFNVPMENQRGGVTCFNFGSGAIRSGKALAAERVLTLPLGSSDKELIGSAPFLKTEFAGRPLSGVYKLRIKDTPTLAWSNLEDVQLLLNYRYWSRVDGSASN